MERTLKLIFKDELAKSRTLAIKDPKDNLKAGEVRPIMEQLITDDVFLNGSSKLKAIGGMKIAYEEDVPE
jgi:hypothetical protein